jgi:4-hydroxy-4-methyl-2-oxoglutarate aldolase
MTNGPLNTRRQEQMRGVDTDQASDVLQRLKAIDVACLSDALESMGLNCVTSGIRPLEHNWRICGPAVTMRLVPLQDRADWELELSTHALMDLAKPGDVIVVDMGGRLDLGAPFGGNTAKDGIVRGLSGVVIDGACRDSEQIRADGFPTFVRGTSSRNSHGKTLTTCLNSEPVQLGMTSVVPGDFIVGDADAIVVIPRARAAKVVSVAEARHALDARTFELMGDADLDRAQLEHRQQRAENRARVFTSYGLGSTGRGLGLDQEAVRTRPDRAVTPNDQTS